MSNRNSKPYPESWVDLILEASDLLSVLKRACCWSEQSEGHFSRGDTALINEIEKRIHAIRNEMDDYHILYSNNQGD